MWEIYKSGSTRGEWVAPRGVALSPTLPRQVVSSHLLLGERESPAADGEDAGAWGTGGVSQDGVADDSFSLAGEARGDVDPGGSAGGGPFAAGGRGDQ